LALGVVPNTQPTHLLALCGLLRNLECQDPRDKVYGVKALIRWPDGTAPVANYGKTSFELAKEVMNIILLQWPSYDGLRDLEPLNSTASSLSTLLELDLRHMPLVRTTKGHDQFTQYSGASAPGRRVGDVNWWGSKLSRNFKLQYCETHAELQSADGTFVAYAASNVQKDDWILQCVGKREDTAYGDFWTIPIFDKLRACGEGLVVRPHQHSDRYSIISPLFYDPICLPITPSDPAGFIIWWDAEDLLVLACQKSAYDSYSWKVQPGYSLGEIVDICLQPKASSAMGPYTPDEMVAIIKDEERLLGPRDG
jgi:hypothetical protein